MKKIFLIIMLSLIISPNIALAKDTSSSSIVVDLNSGRVLYKKNEHKKMLIASTTKIMTAILTIENGKLDEKIEVGNEILKMYGTNIYLEVGEKITIRDLLYGLMLRSGNDASVVLAKYIGGTEENFVNLMNIKAQEIGMTNTTFSNPHGLDDDTENYSTAYDMALLSKYAYENKTYKTIAGTKKYTATTKNKTYLWYNRNKLLSTYEYCNGGKNGYTPKAGRTLITTADKNNLELTVVTLDDANEYETHQELYELIYDKYQNYKLVDKNSFDLSKIKYNGEVYIKNSFIYPLTISEKKLVRTSIRMLQEQNINSDKLGEIIISLEDKEIGRVNIYKRQKEKEDITIFKRIKNYLLDILKKLKLGLQNNLKPGPLVPIPLEINNLEPFIR